MVTFKVTKLSALDHIDAYKNIYVYIRLYGERKNDRQIQGDDGDFDGDGDGGHTDTPKVMLTIAYIQKCT